MMPIVVVKVASSAMKAVSVPAKAVSKAVSSPKIIPAKVAVMGSSNKRGTMRNL